MTESTSSESTSSESTSTGPDTTDETSAAISHAVALGHAGERDTARTLLTDLWGTLGPLGDPLHRCTLAHYLADLQPDPAQSLAWNIRALDAADGLTDDRVTWHGTALAVAGFYPSLRLNLADDYRRLGAFDAAQAELESAGEHLGALAQDPYGDMIRTALREVGEAVRAGDTSPRASAPA